MKCAAFPRQRGEVGSLAKWLVGVERSGKAGGREAGSWRRWVLKSKEPGVGEGSEGNNGHSRTLFPVSWVGCAEAGGGCNRGKKWVVFRMRCGVVVVIDVRGTKI